MFSRVRLITHSIRSLYPSTHVRVSVGSSDVKPFDIYETQPWSRKLDIEWAWVDLEAMRSWKATNNPNIPTMVYSRFDAPSSADFLLFIDADVLAIRPFDELFSFDCAGMMAHASPFSGNHDAAWRALYGVAGLPWPSYLHPHSGHGFMENKLSPPYLNTGVLWISNKAFLPLVDVYFNMIERVRRSIDSYFVDQIAFTLACAKLGQEITLLPPKFNFANQPEFDSRFPDDLADVRFIHFLRTNSGVDRESDFMNLPSIERFCMNTALTGSNKALQSRVMQLLPLMRADYGTP